MTESKSINQVLNAATAFSDERGKSLLMKDSDGNLGSLPYSKFGFTDLCDMEAKDTVLTIREFTEKYIKNKRIGHKLTDTSYASAKVWYVSLKDGYQANMQSFIVEVTKNSMNLGLPWACITLVFYPANRGANAIYIVNQQTGDSADSYSISIKSIPLTVI